ncbi:MAG: hypothetical protein LQ340_002943 [Diploschistes diacapsis]|nr:MAG: hypothetical protein LQ340_002943 [Diploschistes diacapsis]
MDNFKSTFCLLDQANAKPDADKGDVEIYVLGLFDTVNSVGIFDIPFKKRLRIPEAYGTAKHIRHAVAIDERRVKFKAALLSQATQAKDVKQVEDVKEVFFPDNHSDVGGGCLVPGREDALKAELPLREAKGDSALSKLFRRHGMPSVDPSKDPLQLSDIPLKWMIDELEKLPDDSITWNKEKDNFLRNLERIQPRASVLRFMIN